MYITTFNSLTSQDRTQCWVNPSIVPDAMTSSKAFNRVNLMITVNVIMCYGTLDRVESIITVDVIVCDATLAEVESTIMVDVMACYATPEQVEMITTLAREELTITVDAMTCYGTFDGVILTTPEWVNMITTLTRTELTTIEQVNSTTTVWINISPEWVNIVQEWLAVTQSKVNVSALYQVNGTNCGLVIGEHMMNYQITCHTPQNTLMSCMITMSVHDSSKNNRMGCSLWNGVVLNEQSSVGYNAIQPTSQYITSLWFIHSKTSDDKQFGDVMHSFAQSFIWSHAGQLMIDILTWCHNVLSTFCKNYLLFLNSDLSIKKCFQKLYWMLNRFRYYKHDFRMYLSKIWFIETHYNITTLIVYLENIIFQRSAHWKYQEEKVCIVGDFVSQSLNGTGPTKVPPMNYDTDLYSSPIGGGALQLFNFEESAPFIIFSQSKKLEFETQAFKYIDHLKVHEAEKKSSDKNLLFCRMPLHFMVSKLSLNHLQNIVKQHYVFPFSSCN